MKRRLDTYSARPGGSKNRFVLNLKRFDRFLVISYRQADSKYLACLGSLARFKFDAHNRTPRVEVNAGSDPPVCWRHLALSSNRFGAPQQQAHPEPLLGLTEDQRCIQSPDSAPHYQSMCHRGGE